jgi:DNA-binding LytR/AlgR family response regulator
MRVLVVDDEPIARRRLIRMLGRIADVVVAGEAADGEEALEKIAALAPDLLLLDIRMPGLDGLALARRRPLPPVVFTTAYAEHAVEAFGAAAIDYLLKPVELQRLREAIERVRHRRAGIDGAVVAELLAQVGRDAARPPRLVAHRGETSWIVDPREITHLRATDKYVVFDREGKELSLDFSLNELEERLERFGFCRVHRAALVNLERVRAVHRTIRGLLLELDDGERVAVSRRRSAALLERLGMS